MSLSTFTPEEEQALHDPWTLVRFQFFPAGVLGIWAIATQWPAPHWGWQAFWTLFTAYCLFCWTSCFHETAHQTLTANRTTSIWLGRLLGFAMFVPYNIYRESHIRHHAYLNKPSDWELWPYSDPQSPLWFRRVFVWFDFLFGAVTAMYTYGRIFWHRDSPITNPELRRTIWLEYVFSVIGWGALFALFTVTETWPQFLMAWVIPHLIAGWFQNGRKLTEHLGMKSYDPMYGTRTVVGKSWFTKLCTYLNFDIFIHGPHHRHPRVAHRQLRQKMDEYVKASPNLEYPMFRTYRQAVMDMLPSVIRCPGVGMNAGADAPSSEKLQVEDYVTDVNQEILADSDQSEPVSVS